MVVGEHIRDERSRSECRAQEAPHEHAQQHVGYRRARIGAQDLSLDDAVEFLADDELLEVTPPHYRIRKRLLAKQDRSRVASVTRHRADGSASLFKATFGVCMTR